MKRHFSALILAPFLILVCGPVFAPAYAEEIPGLKAGLEAYDFFCMKCHGKNLVNSGVSSYDLRKFPKDQKQRFYDSVNLGRGSMPAWGDVILPEELDALWVYVSTRAGTEPPAESAAKNQQQSVVEELQVADQLTVCMAEEAGAISNYTKAGGSGFDLSVSRAIAEKLGLNLNVIWFDSEQEEEGGPVQEVYAMLSHGLCDLASSHPHYERAVGEPLLEEAPMPRWKGKPKGRLPFVTLQAVEVSRAYMRAEIGLVYRDGAAEPDGLKSLGQQVAAYQQNTLSGALMEIESAALIANAKIYNPGLRFLSKMEAGDADVALVEIPIFDSHRLRNPDTTLKLAKWRHDVGIDIGFAALQSHPALLAAVNEAIQQLESEGTLQQLASVETVTWNKPRHDGLEKPFTWRNLMMRN